MPDTMPPHSDADIVQSLDYARSPQARWMLWRVGAASSLVAAAAIGVRHLSRVLRIAHAARDALAALRDREERLRMFIDNAPVAIAMYDTNMRYLAVSRRFLNDYLPDFPSAADLLGRAQHEVGFEIPPRWRDVHRRVLTGETVSAEEDPYRREDGRTDWMRWEMTPWRHADGRIGGAVLFLENITARKQAELALRDSEARVRLVQRVGSVASFDRLLGEASTLVSDDFARLHGLPAGQTTLSHEQWIALLHPDDRDRVLAERQRALQDSGLFTADYRICRPDGAIRWISTRIEIFPDQAGQPFRAIGALRDITDMMTAREALVARQHVLEQHVAERTAALAEAEARFHGIFDSQFQFIALLAPDGTILEVNRTALDAAGLRRDDVVGQLVWETDWAPAAERDRLPQEIARAAQGAVVRRDVTIADAAGQPRQIDFSLKPLRDATTGLVTSIIAEGRDLTETRNLVAQLVQAQKVQALGQLAGGIAHDFNNILQAVAGSSKLIEQQPGDQDRVRRLAGTMLAAANRGSSITQRLLSLGRRGEIRSDVIPTGDLLMGMSEVLAHTLGTTITVQADVPPDVPPMLADRPQLETAIINLGTNARDAMPNGGMLMLTARAEQVTADMVHPAGLTAGGYVRLSIMDTGAGMNAATLARVSEPFFTTKPEGQGTGLGVATVKSFVEQSGGGLSIASVPGKGTDVVMWLRQAVGDALPTGGAEDETLVAVSTPAHVLVVDDDDLVRETLAAQLEAEGLDTLLAASGAEAIALLEAGAVVDAVVSDLSMPGMNGVTTIEKVRLLRPHTPCFLLTGYVGERAALSGDNAFTIVRKPVAGRTLAMQIEASLAGARR